MARSHLADVVLDPEGDVVAGATVDVFEPGTTTSIVETIFAFRTGGSTLTLPLTTDANGKFEFWLDMPKRVDIRISGTGITTVTRTYEVEASGDQSPLGVLAHAEIDVNQGGITTITDLLFLSVTVNVEEERKIRISANALFQSTVANDRMDLLITDDANVILQRISHGATVANFDETMSGFVILEPTAGSHTYKLRAQRGGGTGTITMVAGSTNPAQIVVEDLGTTQVVH